MAQQLEFNPYDGDSLNKFVDAKLARQKAHTVWYKPSTGDYHLSMLNLAVPDYTGPIISSRERMVTSRQKYLGASSSAERDSARFQPYADEFIDSAVTAYDIASQVKNGEIGKLKAAAIITAKDYTATAIINQILSDEIIDLVYRDFNLMSAVSVFTADRLEVPLPDQITTSGAVSMGLNEMDLPDTMGVAYSQQTTKLKKSGIRLDVSIWFDLVSRRRDPIADTNKFIQLDWDKQYNAEILNQLLVPMADVGAATAFDVLAASGRNTAIPQRVINVQAVNIRNAGGSPNVLVMNSYTLEVLTTNTWIGEGGFFAQEGPTIGPANNQGRNLTISKLPGYQVVIDETLTNGWIFQFDKRTPRWYNGPQRTANYEDTLGSYKGNIAEKWYGTLLWIAGWAKQHTGTTT